MSKNISESKRTLQTRRARSKNDSVKSQNIIDLISIIPKQFVSSRVYTDSKNDIVFTENLLSFLELKHPQELSKLSFKIDDDNFATLQGTLIELILSLDYFIQQESYDALNGTDAKILFNVETEDFMWYVIDVNSIKNIRCDELRIGFAYFINHFANYCNHNALQGDYFEIHDNPYSSEFEMISEEESYIGEDDEIDEGQVEAAKDMVESQLIQLRTVKDQFDIYARQDLKIFYDYKPVSKIEKDFKEFITEGINLDFSVMNNFLDDTNTEDGGVSFSEKYLLYMNLDEIECETNSLSYYEESAMNEHGEPMGYYQMSNGQLIFETSKEQVDQYNYNNKFIIRLYDEFLNKF
jgi:hypothetical protein